jgi:geranylgeranyl transferase type-1 subunit beta
MDDEVVSNFSDTLSWKRHKKYFERCLVEELPSPYVSLDTNRLTLVHFAVQSLDILGCTSSLEEYRQQIIDWIYSLFVSFHVPPVSPQNTKDNIHVAGFVGGTYLGPAFYNQDQQPSTIHSCWKDTTTTSTPTPTATLAFQHVHIAMTYTALCTLAALGDDLSRIESKRKEIISSLACMQQDDGSFTSTTIASSSENDMRFVYCACAISFLLNNWSGVNRDKVVHYIKSCRSYDGSIGLLPAQEGHGGSTFCAVASLALMGRLSILDDQDGGQCWRRQLIRWCVNRQQLQLDGGMQGRPNKAEDTCYSYWIGGTLHLLSSKSLLDRSRLQEYVISCATPYGGFSKVKGALPDMLHSFYSLAWLSLSTQDDGDTLSKAKIDNNADDDVFLLQLLECAIGICKQRIVSYERFRLCM